jgi:hypothetical protein
VTRVWYGPRRSDSNNHPRLDITLLPLLTDLKIGLVTDAETPTQCGAPIQIDDDKHIEGTTESNAYLLSLTVGVAVLGSRATLGNLLGG